MRSDNGRLGRVSGDVDMGRVEGVLDDVSFGRGRDDVHGGGRSHGLVRLGPRFDQLTSLLQGVSTSLNHSVTDRKSDFLSFCTVFGAFDLSLDDQLLELLDLGANLSLHLIVIEGS